MKDRKQTDDEKKNENPVLKDVVPGSDADATPTPEVGKTPPNPNKKSDDEAKE